MRFDDTPPLSDVVGASGGVASSPEEFSAIMKSDMAKRSKVIKDANIRAE